MQESSYPPQYTTLDLHDRYHHLNHLHSGSMNRNHLITMIDHNNNNQQIESLRQHQNKAGSNMLTYRQTSPLSQYAGKVTAIHHSGKANGHSNQMLTPSHHQHANMKVEKPNQVFWEKRLQGIKKADANSLFNLSQAMKKYGPNYDDLAIIQGMTALLYHNKAPVIGQINHLDLLQADPHIWRDSKQPLCPKIVISEGDIKGQEDRVIRTRKKLADILAQCN